ncbi:chromosomal replication initiation protein [Moraxella macacae 0408225]|uniref:Chromosomal replication initiator protein DnaA n=2 Tax=Pseudomonadota TaxID=1224 RepID=L2F9R6_9GAMM|nr:chromosomal replication initiator protein DnaA [Moraxella macacae]ELA09213.1 chromosomal replication initiation protein [Moraxella macacae 0408225]
MISTLWQRCVDELKHQLPDNIFTMWIRPLSAHETKSTKFGDRLIVTVPNDYFAGYVEKNYLSQIQDVIKKLEPDRDILVKIQVNKDSFLMPVANQETTNFGVVDGNQSVNINKNGGKTEKLQAFQTLDKAFTFEQFVTGKSNQIAYSFCKEMVNHLGDSKNNPLFLYGSTGLGKTHLMQAVAHEVVKQGKSFYYFSSDKFISHLVNAIQHSKIDEFKDKIKKVDLLIIDDIHVIAGKRKSSEEFLALFNDFIGNNKQVILASDRHPSALVEFDEYTKSRLLGGVSVALEPPELETRIQILQKKAKSQDIVLPKECAIFMAQHIVANVRELEGVLNKVLAMSRLLNQDVALDLVQMALKDVIAIRVQAVSMDNIRKVVAEFYNVSTKDIMGKKRSRNIVRPRQIAMALARELTNNSLLDIGQSFGGRDHTTVMHACEKVQMLCLTDAIFEKNYRSLKLMLQT